MWKALPEATKRYLMVVEKISIETSQGKIETTVVEEIRTT
jgi:hypothetical protein